jgi:hypothetical protein
MTAITALTRDLGDLPFPLSSIVKASPRFWPLHAINNDNSAVEQHVFRVNQQPREPAARLRLDQRKSVHHAVSG